MSEIRTETKEQGSWTQYIEVGSVGVDRFGDEVFTRKGYVKSFPGLTVERKFDGSGAGTYCRWIITVPDGFPLAIRKVTNPGGDQRRRKYEVLYSPPQSQKTAE